MTLRMERGGLGAFQQSLGLAQNILATRLWKLVACDVLTMAPAADRSPCKEYILAEWGEHLYLAIAALWR